MNGLDLTQVALEALQPSSLEMSDNGNHDEARGLRGRILGVLIRKWRIQAERSPTECAEFMRRAPQMIEAWEYGDNVPCWPQLELLSLYFSGPSANSRDFALINDSAARLEYMLLRQRLIGALLRAARETIGWSIDELSQRIGLEADLIKRFEFGEEKIPVSVLAALAQTLSADLAYFTALPQAPPSSFVTDETRKIAAETHIDLRQFAAQSENRAFIKLAMAFKHIEPDDLHRIANALFAIISAKADSNGRLSAPS
ncbi:MAG: helix-turn-helix domain-containing protein [Chloroflexi bacterium]|nr:helix-turn-helix domain-containing protein [Chloroflexota bacterium]